MLTVELGGKTLSTPKDKLLIHINGMPMEIKGDAAHVYVNDTRVDGGKWPVLELLGLGIAISVWYTLIFTKYGAEFIRWVTL